MDAITTKTLHDDLEQLLRHARMLAGETKGEATKNKAVADANRLLALMDILTLDCETSGALKRQYINGLENTLKAANRESQSIIDKALHNASYLTHQAGILTQKLYNIEMRAEALSTKLDALSSISVNADDPYAKAALLYEQIIDTGTSFGVKPKEAAEHASYIVWAALQQGPEPQPLPDWMPPMPNVPIASREQVKQQTQD